MLHTCDCEATRPSESICQTISDVYGGTCGRHGNWRTPAERTLAVMVRALESTTGGASSITREAMGSNRIWSARVYFARLETSFVGSRNVQSSSNISGVRSPLMK